MNLAQIEARRAEHMAAVEALKIKKGVANG